MADGALRLGQRPQPPPGTQVPLVLASALHAAVGGSLSEAARTRQLLVPHPQLSPPPRMNTGPQATGELLPPHPAGSGCGRAHAFPPLGLCTGCSPTQNAVPSRPARRPPCCRQGSVTCRPREALPNHPVGQTPLTVRGHGWVSFLPGQKSSLAFPPQRVTSRWVCCGHCWAPGPRTVSGHARGLASW